MATLLLSVDITCSADQSTSCSTSAQHNMNYYRVLHSGLERFASLPLPAKDKQAECGHGQIEWRRMMSQKRHRLCERFVAAQHTRVGGQHPEHAQPSCSVTFAPFACIERRIHSEASLSSPPLSSTAFARKSFTHALKVVIIVEEPSKPEPAISAGRSTSSAQ